MGLAPAPVMARIRYRLRMPEPHTHLFGVELEAEAVSGDARLVMPSWTPGSYLMREYARNVVHFEAADGGWNPLPFRKTDKNTWLVDAPGDGILRARWMVNADELTVRTSHLDSTHASVIPASVFMAVAGREGEALELAVEPPENWKVTTALARTGDHVFRAKDFDELVDSPLEIGTHALVEWTVDGVPHRYAIWGRGNWDPQRLAYDTTRIVQAERALFGSLPYPEFTFFLHLTAGGGGGLEHRNSTSLLADRWAFRGPAYENFLGLVAHELFHAWNGKRIRPAVLGPFDLAREAYTRELWVVEGFTTYYTDLVLRRAGLMPPQRYLEKLGDMISRFAVLPGRAVQSLEDASFDAWIKFYRPDTNTPNATVSYYQKGALVALLLDMEIRAHSGNARSLDDLVRVLWDRWGARDEGFPEGAVQAAAAELAGADLSDRFEAWLRGTGELDYGRFLALTGLTLAPAQHAPRAGPQPTRPAGDPTSERLRSEPRTGLQLRMEGRRVVVAHVLAGSAAWRAGVNAGDELVALDGVRVAGMEWLNARLREARPDASVTLSVFRRDELVSLPMAVETGPPERLVLRPSPTATREQQQVLADWLHVRPGEGASGAGLGTGGAAPADASAEGARGGAGGVDGGGGNG